MTPRGKAMDFNLSESSDDMMGSDDMPFGSISGMIASEKKRRNNSGNSGGNNNGNNSGTYNGGSDKLSPQMERLFHGGAILDPLGASGGVSPSSSLASRSSANPKHGLDLVDLNNQDDSPAGLFMRGKLDIVRALLDLVDIEILFHIFNHLPPRMNSATRPVVLHFLTERCKNSAADLDVVGGSSFFKKLLMENDPLIS